MDLTPNELNFVRQALDLVSIKGTDAQFLANLQIKFEKELAEIQRLAEEEERRKVEIQQQIISTETVKSSTKK
jgi:plasmid maintenance system antidote protein VapI